MKVKKSKIISCGFCVIAIGALIGMIDAKLDFDYYGRLIGYKADIYTYMPYVINVAWIIFFVYLIIKIIKSKSKFFD